MTPARLVATLFASALVGCAIGADGGGGSPGVDTSATSCTPGAVVGCPCSSGATGNRTCVTDGAGYGPCECPDAASSTDGSDGAAGCILGTPDDCGTCGNVCSGPDNAGTSRYCSDGDGSPPGCDIECKGEWYDLDGLIADGCEADGPPVQDTAQTAVAESLTSTTTSTTVVGYIYGDARLHDAPPTARPFGRQDWFSVDAQGTGPGGKMTACLGITNFPTDNQFEVCLSDIGQTTFTACQTVLGGATSVCVTPPGGTDGGNPYYVRVQKLAGSNTPNGYALYLAF